MMAYLRAFISIIRIFIKKLKEDSVSAYAAQAAFFIMVSFFPFSMFLLTMIQFLPITESDLTSMIADVLPEALSPFLFDLLSEVYTASTTVVVSATLLSTLWAASKAFYSLIYGLNAVYKIPENRNYFILRFRALIYTLIFAVMLLATLLLLGFGNSIAYMLNNSFPMLKDATLFIISLRTSCIMCILILFFLYLYMVIPNHRSRIFFELPGAVLTSMGWIGFSYLYSFYIDHMANFSNTYGSLTAVVLLMLWLYACMYMLLIGGEINDLLRSSALVQMKIHGKH